MPRRLSERERLDRAWLWAEGRVDEERLLGGSAMRLMRKHRDFLRRRWLRCCVVSTERWERRKLYFPERVHMPTWDNARWLKIQRAQQREKTAREDYEAAGGAGWVTRRLREAGNLTMKPTPGAWKGLQGGLGL